jgi:hypothetical protein
MTNIRMMDRGVMVVARAGRLSFENVSVGLSVSLCICPVHPHPALFYLPSSTLPASVDFFVSYFVVIRCFAISGFACCASH